MITPTHRLVHLEHDAALRLSQGCAVGILRCAFDHTRACDLSCAAIAIGDEPGPSALPRLICRRASPPFEIGLVDPLGGTVALDELTAGSDLEAERRAEAIADAARGDA